LGVLVEQPGVDGERLGATGFCMGGGSAIAWACTEERLQVVTPFYGMNLRPLDAVSRACPVVSSYTEKDFPVRAGRKLDKELERHGIPRDKDLTQGQTRVLQRRVSKYAPDASGDSWRRILAFFKEHIG